MARTTRQLPNEHTMVLLFVIAVFIIDSNLAIMAKEGFSLELVHRDSIQSPLYPGNLTDAQRTQRLMNFSDSRIYWRKSLIAGNHEMALRPSIVPNGYDNMVKLFIGTPPKEVFLDFDTAGRLVWTQCEPCEQCFPQSTPKFVPKDSCTFTTLPCKHPLCAPYPCVDGFCQYHVTYADEKYTKGILAREHFMFQSSSGHSIESIGYLAFGCSTKSSADMYSGDSRIGGILGMNRGPASFVQQLSKHIGGRFSYCLVADRTNEISYLRFGTDIPKGMNEQTIPLMWSDLGHYFIDLKDISINGQRLKLPRGTFTIDHKTENGGCVFDSGTPFTFLVKPAFKAVETALEHHFEKHKLGRFCHASLDLCFEKQDGFKEYPSIAFHFRGGAIFHARPENVFNLDEESICLLMMPDDSNTMLGSILQQNVRMVYDIDNRHVSFFPENCNQN